MLLNNEHSGYRRLPHGTHEISDHALRIATYAILVAFVALIAIAVFSRYIHP